MHKYKDIYGYTQEWQGSNQNNAFKKFELSVVPELTNRIGFISVDVWFNF